MLGVSLHDRIGNVAIRRRTKITDIVLEWPDLSGSGSLLADKMVDVAKEFWSDNHVL